MVLSLGCDVTEVCFVAESQHYVTTQDLFSKWLAPSKITACRRHKRCYELGLQDRNWLQAYQDLNARGLISADITTYLDGLNFET